MSNRLDDEFSASDDATPIHDEKNELAVAEAMLNTTQKSVAKGITKLTTELLEVGSIQEGEKSAKFSPLPAKPFVISKDLKKQSTTVKDLTPTKISNINRSARKSVRGDSKTLQEVRRIVEKWPELEKSIEQLKLNLNLNMRDITKANENLDDFKKESNELLKKRIDSVYNTIRDESKNLEAKMNELLDSLGFKPALENLKTIDLKVTKLGVQFDAVNSQSKDLQRRMQAVEEIANSPFANMLSGETNQIDETVINELKDTVEDIKKNLHKIKAEVNKSIKEQETKLLKKADEDVVNDLEEALHQGIDQVMTSSAKKFSDKRDTNKAIRLLERNLKNMYDLFITRDDPNNEPDDAMLARKHYGFTCMSCEKNLINLEGRKADFNSWSKLPVRDPSERMLRVGHGFSKMLSQIKPDLTRMTEVKEPRPISGRNLSLDPEIGRNTEIKVHVSANLADFNKADTSQLSATVNPKKVSKIKINKKLSDLATSDMKASSVTPGKAKPSQLPKIDSVKYL